VVDLSKKAWLAEKGNDSLYAAKVPARLYCPQKSIRRMDKKGASESCQFAVQMCELSVTLKSIFVETCQKVFVIS